MKFELMVGERVAQVPLQLPTRLHPRVHLRLEEAEGVPPLRLGAKKREIGILQEVIGVLAICGCDSNANADPRAHVMIAKIE